MTERTTSWMMILVHVRVQENSDSRYYSHELFDDTECLVRDSREELLAECYHLRELNKNFIPKTSYDSGQIINFYGPFEVPNNKSWKPDNGPMEEWFDPDAMMTESSVNEAIDSGMVLYKLTA